MYIEYDLCEPVGAEVDLDRISQGKAILIHREDKFIRLLEWTDNFVTPGFGSKMGPGFQVIEYLKSEDPISDTDIVLGGVRYCTQSGMKVRAFFPDVENNRVAVVRLLYRRMFVKIPRNKFRNRIAEFLT